MLLAHCFFRDGRVVYPSWETTPRNFQGRDCAFCQIVRAGDVAIVVICVVVFGSIALFHCMPAGRHSDSTPDSKRVLLCVHDYRALRMVQAAIRTATAVVVFVMYCFHMNSHNQVRGHRTRSNHSGAEE